MVNYWAVLVAAVAAWILGATWYAPPVFGKIWGAAHGITPERMAGMKHRMLPAFAVSFVAYLVIAYIVARIMFWGGRSGVADGVQVALMLWGGFFLLEGLSSHLYSDRKNTVYVIDTGYRLAYMILIGIIIGAWR